MQIIYSTCLFWAIVFLKKTVESASSSAVLLKDKNYRLPNDTYPEHYYIKLTTNVHKGEAAFQGEVTIDIVVLESTSKIVLHALELNISNVSIVNSHTGEREDLFHHYELEREFLTLTRKNNVQFAAETKWKLTINYSGKLRKDYNGFFLDNYIDDEGNKHFFAATNFERSYARHGFPCYDEPGKGANFSISINNSPNYAVISSMPVNKALSSANETIFLTTARIPTYSVGFVISDLEYTEDNFNDLLLRLYSRPDSKQKFVLVREFMKKVLRYYSEYFGIPLMLPKLDLIAAPLNSITYTENWGLLVHTDRVLLFSENTFTKSDQYSHALVAHGISHEWFGYYVTIQWWTYEWLKEGLAALFSYKALDYLLPEWDVWLEFYTIDYLSSLDADSRKSSMPLSQYVQNPKESSINYEKSVPIFVMWYNALTEKVFSSGVRNYLRNNRFGATTEEHLYTAIQNAAGEEKYKLPATINEMMSTWTSQEGYPLLTITRNYEEETFTVKQERYFFDRHFRENKTWYVPINYAVASNPNYSETKATHYLLNVTEMKVNDKIAKTDWLIVNKQSAYYYRIKYDKRNYDLIIQTLLKNPSIIHVRNRAQLINDAHYLSLSGHLDYAILAKMLTYLKKENEYAPWFVAADIFDKYDKYLKDNNDFQSFVAQVIRPIYRKLGVDEIPGEHPNDKLTRKRIINTACNAGLKECLVEANNKLKNAIKKNITIEPNLESVIYCKGLIQSGDDEFNFMYKKLLNAENKRLRSEIINYLSCTKNKNHINKLISSSIDMSNKLQNDERTQLITKFYKSDENSLAACIEFLNDNWIAYGNLSPTYSGTALDEAIRDLATYTVSKNVEEKLLALINKVKNSAYASVSLEIDVKRNIASNYDWFKEDGVPFVSQISQYIDANDMI